MCTNITIKTLLVILFLVLLGVVLIKINTPAKNLTGPHWRGVIPGETTKEELVQLLGQPSNILRCEEWMFKRGNGPINQITYCLFKDDIYQYEEIYDPKKYPVTHEIQFQGGIVKVVKEELRYSINQPHLEDFVKKYGFPEKITWSERSTGARLVFFCSQGLAVQAYIYKSEIEEIFYFPVTPLNTCINMFKYDISPQPLPSPPDVKTDDREDPWGFKANSP